MRADDGLTAVILSANEGISGLHGEYFCSRRWLASIDQQRGELLPCELHDAESLYQICLDIHADW